MREDRRMNAVIYARYSSNGQREESIEGQIKICEEYARKNGYTIIEQYCDRAYTGTNSRRPALIRLLKDSQKKAFQYVIVYSIDRFGRNLIQMLNNEHELGKNGAELISATEPFSNDATGRLCRNIMMSYSQYYSEELAQKINRGLDINAEKCIYNGGVVPLGYKIGDDRHFQIDENTAPIVRFIFERYVKGETVVKICESLNQSGFKSARGSVFNKNSLHTLLRNEKYIGVYTYRDTKVPNGMPRIISDELFYKVAAIMDKNKKAPARARAKEEYILTTKLFCGHCKEMMRGFSGTGKLGKVYRYYECKGRKGKKCDKKLVHKEYIEKVVLTECRNQLTTKNINKIVKEIVKIVNSEKDRSNLNHLKHLLVDYERKHNNLLDSVAECDISSVRQSLYKKLQENEKIIEQIKIEIKDEEKALSIMTAPQIKFFLCSLKKGDINDIKYQKLLINTFVNKIYLYDDRITIIFNASDTPYEIKDKLLSDIDVDNKEFIDEKGLFIDCKGPPKIE